MGDELTDKEKKVLQRTLTDVASVVPIGFLMLLPVSSNSLVTSVVYENVVISVDLFVAMGPLFIL